MANHPREHWLDNCKVLACVLVVLGHVLRGLFAAGVLAAAPWYTGFDRALYWFHVPLLFLCSGYLYQRYSAVRSVTAWAANVRKKLLALGVPYLAFSLVQWAIKRVFSGEVNIPAGDLVQTLLLEPSAPYWFLFVLFLMFCLTPTSTAQRQAAAGAAAALTLFAAGLWAGARLWYPLQELCRNALWFVGGMCLALGRARWQSLDRRLLAGAGGAAGALFLAGGVLAARCGWTSPLLAVPFGAAGCGAAVLVMFAVYGGGRQTPVFGFLARYTLPLYVMHCIFTGGIRAVLLRLGYTGLAGHAAAGLMFGLAGPIAAAFVMRRLRPLDFLLEPTKYIR